MTDMQKKAAKLQNTIFMCYTTIEIIFILVVPIYLWGWLRGLLVASGLTSAMHIVLLLKRLILVMTTRPAAAPVSRPGGRIVIP